MVFGQLCAHSYISDAADSPMSAAMEDDHSTRLPTGITGIQGTMQLLGVCT